MAERSARYGLHTYAVRVSQDPIENEEQGEGIENAPYVVLAPGQWYSAVLIERESRRPYFEWLSEDADPGQDE